MKVNLLRILTIIASAFILFIANPALSYVPDDLDFVPMGDGALSSGRPAAPSGKTYTVPSINYKMVYIPPGTFLMGTPSSEPEGDKYKRQHKVTLTKSFYMGVTEVTQRQWKAVMGSNPSKFKGDNRPVETVSWNDGQEFIRKLNKQEGGNKYRLPTEAEWEYACRAGSMTAFANGGITELKCGYDPNLDEIGWYCGNSNKKTHPVAQKKPNSWGLYDMHGNIWEWCEDSCDYSGGVVTDTYRDGIKDPLCNSGSYRVIRGGGWYVRASGCRSAHRGFSTPDDGYDSLGFRLARTP